MKRYDILDGNMEPFDWGEWYSAEEVDERIAELAAYKLAAANWEEACDKANKDAMQESMRADRNGNGMDNWKASAQAKDKRIAELEAALRAIKEFDGVFPSGIRDIARKALGGRDVSVP